MSNLLKFVYNGRNKGQISMFKKVDYVSVVK